MAAITGAAITAGTAIYGASQQRQAGNRAANAAQQGAQAQIQEQRRQYDLSRADQQPFMAAGYDALDRQRAALDGDFTGFQNSPDYAYSLQQMQQGVERGAAARGSLYSGGHSVDLAGHLNGLANQNFSNYWNRLAGRAGQGQSATSGLAALGANMANQNSMSLGNASQARQSAYLNTGAANAGLGGALGGMFNDWYQQNSANNGGGTGWYLGNNPGKG